jgi:hypothetical protein
MGNELSLDLSQDIANPLTAIADQERAKLIPKNDFNAAGNEYSSVNKDALSDGDARGRGTGVFLDVYNDSAGDAIDIAERKNEIKINKFNSSKPYPNFQL